MLPNEVYLETLLDEYRSVRTGGQKTTDKLRILDFGCGQGETVLEFLRAGHDAFGCDIQEERIQFGRLQLSKDGFDTERLRLIPVQRHVYTFEGDYRLPFEDRLFDIVVAEQVIEHISELAPVLGEWRRILKPNGVILLTFPPKRGPLEGHLRLFFVHWLPYSSFRKNYIRLWNSLGFGAGLEKSAEAHNEYLKHGVFYRPYSTLCREIEPVFEIRDETYRWFSASMMNRSVTTMRKLLFYIWKSRCGKIAPIQVFPSTVPPLSKPLKAFLWIYSRCVALFDCARLVLVPRQ